MDEGEPDFYVDEESVVHFGDIAFDYLVFDPKYGGLYLHVGPPQKGEIGDVSDDMDALIPIRFAVADGKEELVAIDFLDAVGRVEENRPFEVTIPTTGEVLTSPDCADYVRRQMEKYL